MFRQDETVDMEVMETLADLKQMPATSERVWRKLLELNTRNREDQGQRGILAGKAALERLRMKKRVEKQ